MTVFISKPSSFLHAAVVITTSASSSLAGETERIYRLTLSPLSWVVHRLRFENAVSYHHRGNTGKVPGLILVHWDGPEETPPFLGLT
jgi:hypothetical protein